MDKLQERPPYVTFEYHAEEDRAATLADGIHRTKDVAFAHITPPGSKDIIERRADEWLAQIRQAAMDGRYPQEWARGHAENFRAWKDGEEPPVMGTPLDQWPGLSPSQFKSLKNANIRTIEDAAAMNEEGIMRVGMGARSIKDRATSFLKTAANVGATAEQNAALQQENRDLRTQVEGLASAVGEMTNQLTALQKTQMAAPPQLAASLPESAKADYKF